jgi:hypothetical protein
MNLHEDVFTEPSDVDPDTLANLGPLRRLAGRWHARKGIDLNPKADGPERRVFIERINFEPIDPQANGPQLLYGLRYHIHITTEEEDITFHDQVGYWLWEPLASGQSTPDADSIVVTATRGQTESGICSTAFLEYAFRTDSYRIELRFNPDGTFSYVTDTMLIVHGRDEPFAHRDENTLKKVGEPNLNPLAAILAKRAAHKAP